VVREHVVSLNGLRMRYLEGGAGWPVILIHAFPLNADMWRPQLDRAPDGWHFIAPDLRGFGVSGATRADDDRPAITSLSEYADDLEALLNHLKIDEAMIGGLSMGGYVAFALFRQAPERFTGMVLADTKSQADTPEGRAARVSMRTLLAERGPSGVADQMLPKLLSDGTRSSRPALVEETRRLIVANAPEAIDQAIVAMMGRPDSSPDLANVKVPALVLVGEHDTVTPPADAERLHGAMPRSILTVIPGAGHLSNLERPAEFSRALHDFLVTHM
jgi:pimeloyl-ACP methyl ester carboxylesterase